MSSCLSGDNLPEEHCKYTKQSLFSPRFCLSHITHPLLTRRTHYVLQRKCFFTTCKGAQCLTPYVSALGVRKVLCCRSCDECSVSQKCEMKAAFLPLSRRFFSSDDSCFVSQSDCRATICIKRHKQFEKFDLQKVQHSNKVLP